MSSNDTGLRCYRCQTPADPGDTTCRECELALNWPAIQELFALDYLRAHIDWWHRTSRIDARTAERLTDESYTRTRQLLDSIAPPPEPDASDAPPSGIPVVEQGPSEPAPSTVRHDPPVRPRPPVRPPVPVQPARSAFEVLLDPSTLRLMLYVGALLLAAGVIVYLRDTLRVQLQRPIVQASMLGAATFGSLTVGYELVRRSRERLEPRLVGRAFLFLGSLLLPVFFWFLTRSGLVEDRGNAWLVTLLSFAVSTTIALSLGERAFVYLSYAGAMMTAWLLTFRLTGGAAPGVYAVGMMAVSLLFVHSEPLPERAVAGRRWERFGPALFLSGHAGLALTLLFYTNVVRVLRPEVLAAFRHFDASGYSKWMGVTVALVAAEAYAFSAVRRRRLLFSLLSVGCALWAVALMLIAWEAGASAWLLACGATALTATLASRLPRWPELWAAPLAYVGRALEWAGIVLVCVRAIALASGDPVGWMAPAGALLLAGSLLMHQRDDDESLSAIPLPGLAAFALAWAMRTAGIGWLWTDAALAVAMAVAALLIARASGGRPLAATGARFGAAIVTSAVAVAIHVQGFAPGFEVHVAAAVATLAVALAFGLNGVLQTGAPAERYVHYAGAVVAIQSAAFFAWRAALDRYAVDVEHAVLCLAPVACLYLAAWTALRSSDGERQGELAATARGGLWLASIVAGGAALVTIVRVLFDDASTGLWPAAGLVVALPLIGLAAIARERDAILEGAAGLAVGLLGYLGALNALASANEPKDVLIWLAGLGLVPWIFGAFGLLEKTVPALGLPGRFGAAIAAVTLAVVALLLAFTGLGPGRKPEHHDAHLALALLLASYGATAAVRGRSKGGTWLAIAGASAALLVLGDLLSLENTQLVMLFTVVSVGLHAIARRFDAEDMAWVGAPARTGGHVVFALSMGAAGLVALTTTLFGVFGAPNTELTEPVAMFALLAAAAWVCGRISAEDAPVYRALAAGLALVTYVTLGLRLGYHPWRDSVFYTLPVGGVLVAVGLVSARRESESAGPALWLGSVVAAVPLLLHALEYRFVLDQPSFGYDAGTIAVGIALGAIGALFRAKGPSSTGAVVLFADLFVVAFSQIRWAEVHLAVYAIAVGGSLFLSAWVLIYQRDQLERLRGRLRQRREAFARWR